MKLERHESSISPPVKYFTDRSKAVSESGASSASGHVQHTGKSSLAPLITCRESYRDVTYDVSVYASTQILGICRVQDKSSRIFVLLNGE